MSSKPLNGLSINQVAITWNNGLGNPEGCRSSEPASSVTEPALAIWPLLLYLEDTHPEIKA